jgi:hypothetical protein
MVKSGLVDAEKQIRHTCEALELDSVDITFSPAYKGTWYVRGKPRILLGRYMAMAELEKQGRRGVMLDELSRVMEQQVCARGSGPNLSAALALMKPTPEAVAARQTLDSVQAKQKAGS